MEVMNLVESHDMNSIMGTSQKQPELCDLVCKCFFLKMAYFYSLQKLYLFAQILDIDKPLIFQYLQFVSFQDTAKNI